MAAAVTPSSTPPLFSPRSNATATSYPVVASLRLPSRSSAPPKSGEARQQRLSLSHEADCKWRTRISFFPSFLTSKKKKLRNREALKSDLLEAIAPLDRGAEASSDDQQRIDQIACDLESVNQIKLPLKSDFLNGKWELLYTTSSSILGTQRPKFLRPNGKIYQSINVDTLRAQNMETWPFYNQVTALNARRVAVRFDTFKILGLIPIKAPGRGRGELEITYLDDEIRVSRGDKGNLFILKMVDPSYRVPLASSK